MLTLKEDMNAPLDSTVPKGQENLLHVLLVHIMKTLKLLQLKSVYCVLLEAIMIKLDRLGVIHVGLMLILMLGHLLVIVMGIIELI